MKRSRAFVPLCVYAVKHPVKAYKLLLMVIAVRVYTYKITHPKI